MRGRTWLDVDHPGAPEPAGERAWYDRGMTASSASELVLHPGATVALRGGVALPRIGLGVFRAGAGAPTRDAVLAALRTGYRHIDTARIYGNEKDVGEGVRQSGLPRDEVFVTTKLWNEDHGYDRTLRAFDQSLATLGLGHVDLYLVHWPVAGRRRETWRAMEAILASGRCRAIGVSNFLPRHLDDLLAEAHEPPSVNQIELHPFLQQRDLVERCRRDGIVVEAYSPLTRGERLDHPEVARVAARHGKSAAQVLVRWSLERGFVVLPKSSHPKRLAGNFAVFDFALDADDLRALDALEEGLRVAWDPHGVP